MIKEVRKETNAGKETRAQMYLNKTETGWKRGKRRRNIRSERNKYQKVKKMKQEGQRRGKRKERRRVRNQAGKETS